MSGWVFVQSVRSEWDSSTSEAVHIPPPQQNAGDHVATAAGDKPLRQISEKSEVGVLVFHFGIDFTFIQITHVLAVSLSVFMSVALISNFDISLSLSLSLSFSVSLMA